MALTAWAPARLLYPGVATPHEARAATVVSIRKAFIVRCWFGVVGWRGKNGTDLVPCLALSAKKVNFFRGLHQNPIFQGLW